MLGEAEDSGGGVAVVEEAEVFALKTGNELAMLVGDGEDEIYFVDLYVKGLDGLLLILSSRILSSGSAWLRLA